MRDAAERAAPGTAGAEARPAYAGRGWPLFRMALRGGVLTLLTLGLHRFWYVTRLRRFHWSALSFRGEALEYTGRATELLLGFLVALVVLAAVLGAVNLALAFGGVVAGFAPEAAFNAALPAIVPLWFFAEWKARRYRAARTRWRGIRFGMEGGAWGYALRGTLWSILVGLSLGLARPAMQVALRRRVMNAMQWGDMRFRQGGDWRRLIGPWFAVWGVGLLGLVLTVASGWEAGAAVMQAMEPATDAQGRNLRPPPPPGPGVLAPPALALLATAAAVWLMLQRYAAAFEREMTGALSLEGGLAFASDLRAGRLIRIRLTTLLAYLALVAALVGATALAMAAGVGGGAVAGGPSWPVAVAAALVYAAAFAGFGAVREAIYVRPMIRAHAEAMTLSGAGALDAARQRPEDAAREAGGFAEALDVDLGF